MAHRATALSLTEIRSGATSLGCDRHPPDGMVTVVIAHGSARRRARWWFALERETHITVLGEAATGDGARTLAARVRPDVVVIAVDLDELGPAETTRRIRTDTRAAVLLVSNGETDHRVLAALQAGAGGMTLDDTAPSRLTSAVTRLGRGRAPRRRRHINRHPQEQPMVTPKVIEMRRGSAHGGAVRDPRPVQGAGMRPC
jgi:DNA-binding NarL/FixJ family response regulator